MLKLKHVRGLTYACMWTLVFIRWLNGFFWEGSKRNLDIGDLHKVLPNDKSKKLGDRLSQEWDKELANCKSENENNTKAEPSLRKAIIRQFGWYFMGVGLLAFIEECFTR